MAYCSSCGTQMEGQFCPKCGAAAAAAAAPGAKSTQPIVSTQPGLSINGASALCYLFGFVTGIIFLVLAPYNQDRRVRFHAFQSIFTERGGHRGSHRRHDAVHHVSRNQFFAGNIDRVPSPAGEFGILPGLALHDVEELSRREGRAAGHRPSGRAPGQWPGLAGRHNRQGRIAITAPGCGPPLPGKCGPQKAASVLKI